MTGSCCQRFSGQELELAQHLDSGDSAELPLNCRSPTRLLLRDAHFELACHSAQQLQDWLGMDGVKKGQAEKIRWKNEDEKKQIKKKVERTSIKEKG